LWFVVVGWLDGRVPAMDLQRDGRSAKQQRRYILYSVPLSPRLLASLPVSNLLLDNFWLLDPHQSELHSEDCRSGGSFLPAAPIVGIRVPLRLALVRTLPSSGSQLSVVEAALNICSCRDIKLPDNRAASLPSPWPRGQHHAVQRGPECESGTHYRGSVALLLQVLSLGSISSHLPWYPNPFAVSELPHHHK
jgi:hypothetical protein